MITTTGAVAEMCHGPGGTLLCRRHSRTNRRCSLRIRGGGAARGAMNHAAIEPEGDFAFEDEEQLLMLPLYVEGRAAAGGSTVFVPRGMPHCSKNCSDKPARVFTLFTPGDIAEFFDY